MLSAHRFDNIKNNTNTSNESRHKNNDDNRSKSTPDEVPSLSFAQLEGACYCYGKKCHRSNTCRHKDRPKEEWAINKVKREQSHVQS